MDISGTLLPCGQCLSTWHVLGPMGVFEGTAHDSLFGFLQGVNHVEDRPSSQKWKHSLKWDWRACLGLTCPCSLPSREENGHSLLAGTFWVKDPKAAWATRVPQNSFQYSWSSKGPLLQGRVKMRTGHKHEVIDIWILWAKALFSLLCTYVYWLVWGGDKRRTWGSPYCLWVQATFSSPVSSAIKIILSSLPDASAVKSQSRK